MRVPASIQLVTQPQEYFRELLLAALQDNQIAPRSHEVEFYLVNLLFQFMKADYFFRPNVQTGTLDQECLVEILQHALEEKQPQVQKNLFRRLGDLSLYHAGFFYAHLYRQLGDVDYYIQMGEMAYQTVGDLSEEETLKKIYLELADRFPLFVQVLSCVSEKVFHQTEKDLLRTYETWVQTRSEKAEKTLREAGILPTPILKKSC